MQLDDLIQEIGTLNAEDALRTTFTSQQWQQVGAYLTRHELRAGDVLIKEGYNDRYVYFLAQGTLQVFASQVAPGGRRIAILRAGSVVGEPGLFGEGARMANVEVMTLCVVYALPSPRFTELTQRLPILALELLRSAGQVMAIRMRANLVNQVPRS